MSDKVFFISSLKNINDKKLFKKKTPFCDVFVHLMKNKSLQSCHLNVISLNDAMKCGPVLFLVTQIALSILLLFQSKNDAD